MGNTQNITLTKNDFKPTRNMIKWLHVNVEHGYSASIEKIAQEVGIDRRNWYFWLKKEGFVNWWDEQTQKFLKLNRWKLDHIGFKKAENDYRYWKDMMNRTGNTIPDNINVGQQVNTQFCITDEHLERII